MVSMNTTHNYILAKEDNIEDLLVNKQGGGGGAQDNMFSLSLVLYDEGREFVIGNAHLPIEDIVDLIENYKI